jgi:hypothetical protein
MQRSLTIAEYRELTRKTEQIFVMLFQNCARGSKLTRLLNSRQLRIAKAADKLERGHREMTNAE